MTAQTTARRMWPGRGAVADEVALRRPRAADRFGDFGFVVVVAAAERYAVPECWGLGLALAGTGSTFSAAQLVVADDLADRDPGALAVLEAWAAASTVAGALGPVTVEIVSRSAFLHPTEGLFSGTYWRGRWCVTGDGGRSLGLLADHFEPGRGQFKSGWSLGLPGWGEFGTWIDKAGHQHSGWRAHLHQPKLRLKPMADHGLAAEYGRAGRSGLTPDGKPAGHWERGKPFLGRFLDVVGTAGAFDGEDTGALSEHLAAFRLPAADVPAAVVVGVEGAAELLRTALSIHGLALRLDQEAGRWLSTREDQRDGIARVSVGRVASPGTLASKMLNRSGLTPPLAKFPTPDDRSLDHWSSHQHGGWSTAELRGRIIPAVDFDARSAHPASWCLLGCWGILRAQELVEADARAEVMEVLRACAAADFAPLLDRATYRKLGLTRVQVVPNGEPWPVQVDPRGEGSAHLRIGPAASSDGRSRWLPWPWVAVAALLSGRVPEVRRALRLSPASDEVEQSRPIPIFDRLVVPAGEDPVPWLVRLRTEAKARIRAGTPLPDDQRLTTVLRVIVNALAYGQFARLDDRNGTLAPARWSWPPVAATVPACTALWLAICDRWVADQGGAIINRDTDGMAILGSPDGGSLSLGESGSRRVLPYGEVRAFLDQFDGLDPFGDGGQFFDMDTGESGPPLHMLVLARKRYLKLAPDGTGDFEPVDHTEHAVGGNVAPPPTMAGRDVNRRWRWTAPGAARALDVAMGVDRSVWSAPWDSNPEVDPWPAVRRLTAVSRDALRPHRRRNGRRRVTVPPEVPAGLGLHPFGPYVQASLGQWSADRASGMRAPVALDPGTDLAEWSALRWFDAATDRQLAVATDVYAQDAVQLESLTTTLRTWSLVRPDDEDGEQVIDFIPELERRIGPWAPVVAAQLADDAVDPEDFLAVLDPGKPALWVAREAKRLGAVGFHRRYGVALDTAKRLAAGERQPGTRTVALVLRKLSAPAPKQVLCAAADCERPVRRAGAQFHSEACRKRDSRQRAGAGQAGPVEQQPCAMPGCPELARRRSATCSERHRKELWRLRQGATREVG